MLVIAAERDVLDPGLPRRHAHARSAGLTCGVLGCWRPEMSGCLSHPDGHSPPGITLQLPVPSQVLPNCTAEVVPGSKHLFSRERMEQACQRVLQFFRERCGT